MYSGSEIQNFDGNLDAIAGSLADLEIYVDCGQPHDLVGPPDLDAIATLQDGACSIDDPVVLQARTIFARGIGP